MVLLDKIKKDLELIFTNNPNRLKHIYGVRDLAIELSIKYNCDVYKAEVSALLHDICKDFKREDYLRYMSSEEIDNIDNKVLLHAICASKVAYLEYGINDVEILNAIKSHVYGNMNMTLLDKIILLSDFCEHNRSYNYCIQTRKVLLNNEFNKALSMCLNLTIKSLEERSIKPDLIQIQINEKYKEK